MRYIKPLITLFLAMYMGACTTPKRDSSTDTAEQGEPVENVLFEDDWAEAQFWKDLQEGLKQSARRYNTYPDGVLEDLLEGAGLRKKQDAIYNIVQNKREKYNPFVEDWINDNEIPDLERYDILREILDCRNESLYNIFAHVLSPEFIKVKEETEVLQNLAYTILRSHLSILEDVEPFTNKGTDVLRQALRDYQERHDLRE